jgi:CO/xanthine dehydrogenase Mo-binding subunit
VNATAQIQGAACGCEPDPVGAPDVQERRDRAEQLHEYKPIRLADVPQIDVQPIQCGRQPSGVGEPSSTVVAPAVANAIYNAIGVRVRHMPITPEAILDGLKSKA